jgi:hypothetical protein
VGQKSGSKLIREGLFMEKNETNQTTLYPRKTSGLSGYKGLIVAMLQLMMKDLTVPDSEIEVSPHDSKGVIERKKKKKGYKRSAYKFVRSEWFEDLCWYIGVNPDPIRRYAIERYNEYKKK